MQRAQYFINALRNHEYFEVLKFAQYVNDKYQTIKNLSGGNQLLGADDLVQLVIYELCCTDINKDDIEKINFLFSYIDNQPSLSMGVYGYAAISIATPASLALASKKNPDLKAILNATVINSPQRLGRFLKDDSPFSTLLGQVDFSEEFRAITTPLAEHLLYQKMEKMDVNAFNAFHTEISRIKKDEDVSIKCPYNDAFEFKRKLNKLKLHLENKLVDQDVLLKEGQTPENLSAKQEKLLIRYSAIDELELYCRNKFVFEKQDKNKIRQALGVCFANEPSWYERTLMQQLCDILTLGLLAAYRGFFSKELKYKREMQRVIEIDGMNEEVGGMDVPDADIVQGMEDPEGLLKY